MRGCCRKGALAKDNYPHAVITHMCKARTAGTLAMTRSRWRAWYAWCRLHHVDPLRCTTPELSVYLVSRFDSGKAVSTIRGYLSAIATIRLATKHDIVAGNIRLTSLLQGLAKQRPTCLALVPKWDLTLVLLTLRKPPYEPLHKASHKSLTLKVALLTQPALAARPCEPTSYLGWWASPNMGARLHHFLGLPLKSTNPNVVRMMCYMHISSKSLMVTRT